MSVRLTAVLGLMVAWLVLIPQGQAPGQSVFGDNDDFAARHHTQVKLVLNADAFYPAPAGRPVALLDLKMDPGWHTYWKNPGDAGSVTKIEWHLPPGVTVVSSGWPVPKKLPPVEVTTYGYEDEAVLPAVLEIASNTPPGKLTLKAHVSWLECKDTCIPASTEVEVSLTVAGPGEKIKTLAEAQAADPERARVVALWEHSLPLPQAGMDGQVRVWWEPATAADTRPLVIEWAVPERDADFYPNASDQFDIQGATETFTTRDGNVGLRKLVKKYSGDWPAEISGLLVLPHRTNSPAVTNGFREIIAYEVKLPVAATAPTIKLSAGGATGPTAGAVVAASSSGGAGPAAVNPGGWLFLGRMLGFAFLGGLILNVMPCVLPVIALKILGFVSEAGSRPQRVRALGTTYTLGVLASFLVLAAIVIGVKAAGRHPGWGMQFGSPIFVVCLTTLVLLVALNLFGVFEVALGGRALDAASGLTGKGGLAGAFFNGALATTLATSCTAPFLAGALGFAITQSALLIVAIFLAAGLGLASPYLVLSWQPGWLKFLPRPGPWMEKFKNAMGFPMLATLVWLFCVASSSYGKNVLWLGFFLVLVASAAWVFGEFVQRGRQHQILAAVVSLLLLGGGYVFALEKELNWRTPAVQGLAWQPWSPAAVATARAAGRPVLVDFTADWCLTCQVNRKTSLEAVAVLDRFKALNVAVLEGDYTRYSDAITIELNKYQRAGVPLVLVYPKDPAAAPIVLPGILTPGIVLEALDRAK